MRLGFYANYTPDTAAFAHEVGFDSIELSAWPGSSLDASTTTDEQIAKIREDLASKNIEISALGYYPNYLDPTEGKEAQEYLVQVLDLAKRMGISTVATFAGRDPSKSVAANLPLYKEVFSRLADEAETRGLRLAIENCPMMDVIEMKGINIAFSPEVWEMMFDAVPSRAIGLEIDPSHMVWLGIDYVKAVRDFGDRIYHAHAKDMEIVESIRSRTGIYGQLSNSDDLGHGWWRARTPGWGDVDWPAFITALIEVGYAGNLDIEHEDEVFAKAAEIGQHESEADLVARYSTERRGLRLGYNTLRPLVA